MLRRVLVAFVLAYEPSVEARSVNSSLEEIFFVLADFVFSVLFLYMVKFLKNIFPDTLFFLGALFLSTAIFQGPCIFVAGCTTPDWTKIVGAMLLVIVAILCFRRFFSHRKLI